MIVLEGKNITKSYDGKKVIENVSLYAKKGEMVSLLGASGVGKTTLFNILSGLENCDEGKVIINGEDVTNVSGKVGYMQQSDLLLPFKTVIKNVMIPLELRKVGKKESVKRAEEILDEFSLLENRDMYPKQLSGGMRQRVSLARTLMMDKDIILLDEPFSALDAITRSEIRSWFKETVNRHNITTVLITHDVDEAIELSDRIYIMKGTTGKVTDEFLVEGDLKDLKELILNKVK